MTCKHRRSSARITIILFRKSGAHVFGDLDDGFEAVYSHAQPDGDNRAVDAWEKLLAGPIP